jgi:hypothetical protein
MNRAFCDLSLIRMKRDFNKGGHGALALSKAAAPELDFFRNRGYHFQAAEAFLFHDHANEMLVADAKEIEMNKSPASPGEKYCREREARNRSRDQSLDLVPEG